MSHRLYEPPMIAWGRAGARVRVALTSTRGDFGSRRWSVRMTHGAEQYELPLGFTTPAGLDPMQQTRGAVLSCAGRLLAELGAIPTDATGAPIGDEAPVASPTASPSTAAGSAPEKPARRPMVIETPVRSFPLLGARLAGPFGG